MYVCCVTYLIALPCIGRPRGRGVSRFYIFCPCAAAEGADAAKATLSLTYLAEDTLQASHIMLTPGLPVWHNARVACNERREGGGPHPNSKFESLRQWDGVCWDPYGTHHSPQSLELSL